MPFFHRSSEFNISGGHFYDSTSQIIINNNGPGTVLGENKGTTNIYVGGTPKDCSSGAQYHQGSSTQQQPASTLDHHIGIWRFSSL
ncbi:hypothetical protein P691DRAFT_537914 [Macrolepiota fuliginosa MF-IS2]|uniref:Uncharacterized protein n=1 Tax=Macrolepiota fuliginosa MF-IS2 TaxID=1400762 RepID=A0A9P6C5V1_9AGAR|nr:hypothetical protein P691DRAFT_537914 [Macrolepiota fuliginosa MF-IS2]